MAQQNFIGRRKTSTARLYISEGKGDFVVNGKPFEDYFPTKARQNIAKLPFAVSELENQHDIKVTVRGGGITGQAGAISLAIARAIDTLYDDKHDILKQHGLLTRDDRMVERKKYGQPKARKRFQFSKR
ncbi:MAG: 30S ribosomal protein S9 [Balneolaceae bacterium]